MRYVFITVLAILVLVIAGASLIEDNANSLLETQEAMSELSDNELDATIEVLEENQEGAIAGQAFKRLPKRFTSKVGRKVTISQLRTIAYNEKVSRQLAQPRFEIRDVSITSINRRQVELRLVLFKPGQMKERRTVEFHWIENGRKIRFLGTKEMKFDGAGFINAMTVDVGDLDVNAGSILIEIPECDHLLRCQRNILLDRGDLQFHGRPQIERRGTSTILRQNVRNNGILTSPECTLNIRINDRIVRSLLIPELEAEEIHQFDDDQNFRYNTRELAGTRFHANLECDDLSDDNNYKTSMLK